METSENALENLKNAAKSHESAKSQAATEIENARKNLAFTENMMASRVENAKTARDIAVYTAHSSGVAITTIAKVLGIKNRASIYAVIERYAGTTPPTLPDAAVQNPPAPADETPTVEKVERTRSGLPGWKITWPDELVAEVYTNQDGNLQAVGAGRKRWDENPGLADLLVIG